MNPLYVYTAVAVGAFILVLIAILGRFGDVPYPALNGDALTKAIREQLAKDKNDSPRD